MARYQLTIRHRYDSPPHIVAEKQMMKERMDFMMNALRGRVSSDLNDLFH